MISSPKQARPTRKQFDNCPVRATKSKSRESDSFLFLARREVYADDKSASLAPATK
jgi:hypothetical protein